MPTANNSAASAPISFAFERKNFSGVLSNKPHPSPDLPSAAIAPRCVKRAKESMEVLTSQWLGLLSICAISPNPQLSFSNAESYKPA